MTLAGLMLFVAALALAVNGFPWLSGLLGGLSVTLVVLGRPLIRSKGSKP